MANAPILAFRPLLIPRPSSVEEAKELSEWFIRSIQVHSMSYRSDSPHSEQVNAEGRALSIPRIHCHWESSNGKTKGSRTAR